jgi:site-specific recombinase XerD
MGLGSGLRRAEAVALTFDDVKMQSVGNQIRTVLNVKGKGAKDRVIPICEDLQMQLAQGACF